MAGLRGENRIVEFRQVAKRLASQISALEKVAGIVFSGGLVRGFADKYSDVDITVLLDRKDDELRSQIRKMGLDEEQRSGVEIDLEIHSLPDYMKLRWDQTDKWHYSKSEIVFDPTGEIGRSFARKLKVTKSYWIRRMATCAEYLKWYCCPPAENIGTIAEAWIDRGDLMSAHYCLNYAIDLIFEMVFAINREFLPPQKWRVFCLGNLDWLPSDFRRLMEEVMIVKSLSPHDLGRRIRVVRKLWHVISPKVEQETGLDLDSLSKYYVKTVLYQA